MNGIAKIIILFILTSSSLISQTKWADTVYSFTSEKHDKINSANQVTGHPNTLSPIKSPNSWTPLQSENRHFEEITVGFNNTEKVNFLLLNINKGKESLNGILLLDDKSNELSLNISESLLSDNEGKFIFAISPAKLVKRAKLILNIKRTKSDIEVDAIGITNDTTNVWSINEVNNRSFEGKVTNMGTRINSIYSELEPVISADNKTLFFTRDGHPENIGADKNQDIWISKKEGNRFQKAINPYNPLNNEHHNFIFSTNSDGSKLLMSTKFDINSPPILSQSTFKGNSWSELDTFEFVELNKSTSFVSYSLSQGQNIMFVSMAREDSYGGSDIYYSKKTNGKWGELKNLGPNINTAADEITPYIANDNKTLYFSTDGWPGYGDKDLFVSKYDEVTNQWSQAKNLGSQINTEGWEAYLTISSSNQQAYFVSTTNSMGAEDIFTIQMPNEANPSNSVIVKGKVTDISGNPLASIIEYTDLNKDELIGNATSSSSDGTYQITLPVNSFYGISAKLDGYYPISKSIDLTDDINNDLEVDIILKEIKKDSSFVLNNIFFEFGKSELNRKSQNELNRLVDILKQNESIKLQLIGFTDSIGSSEDNQILSENRAKEVYNYLINNGISKNRLEYIGKGEIKSNKNIKLQQHRKVIFKIIEISK
jgi:outer membrane protein OmpA-like peptidoglycan-associated protein